MAQEITITASRFSNDYADSVGGREIIQIHSEVTLGEALEEAKGLYVSRAGGVGQVSSVSINGAASSHTVVLLDGMQINNPTHPSRSVNLSEIDLDNTEKIEVLSGGQGVMYGNGAMGGVINLKSAPLRKEKKVKLVIGAGSDEHGLVRGSFQDYKGNIIYRIAARHDRAEGISAARDSFKIENEKDGYESTVLHLDMGGRWDDLSFNCLNQFQRHEVELDRGGGPGMDDPNYYSREKDRKSLCRVTGFVMDSLWKPTVNVGDSGYVRKLRNDPDESNFESLDVRYLGRYSYVSWQNELFFSPSIISVLGSDYSADKVEAKGDNLNSFSRKIQEQESFYWFQRILSDDFIISGGARYEKTETMDGVFSSQIRFERTLKGKSQVYALWSDGFKNPSLYQRYSLYGNSQLRSERGKNIETGITFFISNVFWNFQLFKQNYRYLIDYDYSLQKYVNLLQAPIKGLQTGFRSERIGNWSLEGHYAYIQAVEIPSGKYLLQRPKSRADVGLGYYFSDDLFTMIRSVYVGKREDYASRMPGYILINGFCDYRLDKEWKINFRIDNLLNKKYQQFWGYNTEGRTVYGGLQWDMQ